MRSVRGPKLQFRLHRATFVLLLSESADGWQPAQASAPAVVELALNSTVNDKSSRVSRPQIINAQQLVTLPAYELCCRTGGLVWTC